MSKIEEFLNLIPAYYKKENTIKFINTIKPIFIYLNNLIEESIGMQNIQKAHGKYLDYIGYKMQVPRGNLNDVEYRKILEMQRFKHLNIPTTEGLIKLAEKMTDYLPEDIIFRPLGEPASQYFRYSIENFDEITKFPNLNEVCDAGARMYWDLKILDDSISGNFFNIIDIRKKIELLGDFEVNQKVNIEETMNFASVLDIRKRIEIKGA